MGDKTLTRGTVLDHSTASGGNQYPNAETIALAIGGAAGTVKEFSSPGNYFILNSALGTITATIKGTSSNLTVRPGRVYYFGNDFGIPTTLQFVSTVANDNLNIDFGYGFQIPVDLFPGGPGGAAQVAASVDEFLPFQSLAATSALTETFKFAAPTVWVSGSVPIVGTPTGSINIAGINVAGETVQVPFYDQYGNVLTDNNGNVQANQLALLTSLGNNFTIFADGTGLASVRVTNNMSAGFFVSIGGAHFPASLMIGKRPQHVTYHAVSAVFSFAAVGATDILTIVPPTNGSMSGRFVLERMRISFNWSAGSGYTLILLRRSTLDTGGTLTSVTLTPRDPFRATTVAVLNKYTANPTGLGTLFDTVDELFFGQQSTASEVDFDFRNDEEKPFIPFYNGSTWCFALNAAGQSIASNATQVTIDGHFE